MTIWIMLATLAVYGDNLNVSASNNKYAFTDKSSCEYAIAESKTLKCYPLMLIEGKLK